MWRSKIIDCANQQSIGAVMIGLTATGYVSAFHFDECMHTDAPLPDCCIFVSDAFK